MLAESNQHILLYYFLTSPTDDDYAVSLVFTQRFSVGHFWSPYRITTESIFCKFFINANKSIRCKYWISISKKQLIFTQLGQFRPQYTTITGLRLRVPVKLQTFYFQGFAIFLLDFAPHLHHINLQIAGVSPGIKCIFIGKLLSVPSFFGY